jgi:glycosyltransferase involved in cell wall biosynthesis
MPGGDALGIGRLIWTIDRCQPDVVVLLNDPWHVPLYTRHLKQFKEYAQLPTVGYIAVDGLNCAGRGMNHLDLAVFWTEFAEKEARLGGFKRDSAVVPLGVDLMNYYPEEKPLARTARGLPSELHDVFIVGNANRNQPRKRLDLTIRYFAKWLEKYPHSDAYLYLHVAPTGDKGYDCEQLADYYGVKERLMLMTPEMFYGITEEQMRDTYNTFDVQISTTQGEGFGLTTLEGMACGVPQIVPNWSALGELTKDAAWQIPCTSTCATHNNINVIGGIMDEDLAILALEHLYRYKDERKRFSEAGLLRVNEKRFRWRVAGESFRSLIGGLLGEGEVQGQASDDREAQEVAK